MRPARRQRKGPSGSTTLRVEIASSGDPTRYSITIGSGVLERLPKILRRRPRPSRLHVISDQVVWKTWGSRLHTILSRSEIPVGRSVVPSGEGSKSSPVLTRIWRELVQAGCDRQSLVLAFGGGVVGDLAGFAAATVLRGIGIIQIPTTLLAMVDASVGGKTGINLREGKNLVGSFHQPLAVLMDLDLLSTLPRREMQAGWAEVIKTAAILDLNLLRYLERNRKSLLARRPGALQRVVHTCARLKARVVRQDERDSAVRMILNFGHTLAHALEASRGYSDLLHGEAVAVGMAFAARFGEELGNTPAGTATRLEKLLTSYGLPTHLQGMRVTTILRAMERDKKRGAGGLRWVFLPRLGKAEIHEGIPWSTAREAIRRFARNQDEKATVSAR